MPYNIYFCPNFILLYTPRWLDNIKMDLGEIVWGGIGAIGGLNVAS
jgi:hypothetical protein